MKKPGLPAGLSMLGVVSSRVVEAIRRTPICRPYVSPDLSSATRSQAGIWSERATPQTRPISDLRSTCSREPRALLGASFFIRQTLFSGIKGGGVDLPPIIGYERIHSGVAYSEMEKCLREVLIRQLAIVGIFSAFFVSVKSPSGPVCRSCFNRIDVMVAGPVSAVLPVHQTEETTMSVFRAIVAAAHTFQVRLYRPLD